jgi:hypothetical protein
MQQEKDYLQREVERITLFLKTLLRRVAGLKDENFEPQYNQLEKDFKEEVDFSLSELGAMNALTLEKYLKKIHPSHIEKIVQITYEVIQKKQALQISINSGMIVNALKMLNHLNTTSKTYSIERQNLQSKLQKILESSTEQD